MEHTNENTPASEKPPPIIIEGVTNFNNLCQLILRHVKKENFITKTLTNRTNKNVVDVTVKLNLVEDYRKLIHALKESGARYHTYQLKQDRAHRVVLRNLHPSTPSDLIKEDLEQMGFSVRNIINVLHPATKAPLPLFFVDLNPGPKNKEIYTVEAIAHTRVKVEEPKRRQNIVQCFRCQAYGHTKSYCHRSPRCVKCGEEHLTAECKLPSNGGQTKCALCQGNHTASYKGCTTYRELEARLSRRVQPQTSYSAAARGPPPPAPTVPAASDFPPLQDTVQPTHSAPVHPSALSRGHGIAMPSYIPPPPSSSDISSLLTNFLNDFKNLITPLITALSTVMTQLIPALIKK